MSRNAYPVFLLFGIFVWGLLLSKKITNRLPRTPTLAPVVKNPRVLITGVGRSGTTGLNLAFTNASFKTKHEQHGKEISVGWPFGRYHEYPMDDGFNNQWHNYNNRHHYEKFDVHIQLVRHPLKTISSWTSLQRNPSRNYVVHMTPNIWHNMSKIQISMMHWYDWNTIIERYADKRWQIETVDIQHECSLLWIDDARCRNVQLRPKLKINTRKHELYSWSDLSKIDKELTNKIQEMCVRYGYEHCSNNYINTIRPNYW